MVEMNGKQKAAVLLVSLGPELSAQIYRHLRDEEIEVLTREDRQHRQHPGGRTG